MKTGTEGFIGERLREAREVRGLTAAALADLLGITRAAVSQYEHNHKTPAPEVMAKIAELLRLPERFFMQPVDTAAIPERRIFYRSQSAATKAARIRSERKYEWLSQIVGWLESFVAFPKVDLPELDIPDDVLLLSGTDIEEAAEQTRRSWNLGDGPISNMAWLLENHGILVATFALHADTLDSFSEHHPCGRPYVIISNDREAAVRARFDAAHELGHLLLHRGVPHRDLLKPAEHKLIEDQANKFASAFLMPAAAITRATTSITLEGLKSLKRQWGTSMQAIVMRLFGLNVISEELKTRFFRAFSARGWRKAEPYDDVIPLERPELLRQAIETLLNHRVLLPRDILDVFPYAARDIEELCLLPEGMLGVHAIASQIRAETVEKPRVAADVIPFRPRDRT